MINYDKISQDFGEKNLTLIDLCGFKLNQMKNFHILFVLIEKVFDKRMLNFYFSTSIILS